MLLKVLFFLTRADNINQFAKQSPVMRQTVKRKSKAAFTPSQTNLRASRARQCCALIAVLQGTDPDLVLAVRTGPRNTTTIRKRCFTVGLNIRESYSDIERSQLA